MTDRTWRTLAWLALLIASGGCASFRNPFAPAGPPAPQVIHPAATLDEVMAAVNANTSRVRTYSAPGSTIMPLGMPGVPALTGSVMMERPSRFRIRAGTVLTGSELDLGGNENLLWMWLNHGDPPGVYVCRRENFATSQASALMPVDPNWLPAALGLVEFDPQDHHAGPRLLPDKNIEITSTISGPTGPLTRVCVVDPTRAWVLQQHVYDATGQPLATAIASQHRYLPEHQVSLPQRVEIRSVPARLALALDVGQIYLNTPLGDGQLWMPPQIQGVPQVDISGAPAVGSHGNAARPAAARTTWHAVHRPPRPSQANNYSPDQH